MLNFLNILFYDDLFSTEQIEHEMKKDLEDMTGMKKENEFIDVSAFSGFKEDGFEMTDKKEKSGVDYSTDFNDENDDFKFEDMLTFKHDHDQADNSFESMMGMSNKTIHSKEKIGKIKITDLENFKW